MTPMNRRSFLGAATLGPVAAALLPRAASAQKPKPGDYPTDSFDPWIEVHAPNLAHNTREVARVAGKRPIMAVIKNNGYGLGGATVARQLEPLAEIDGFAVVKMEEAVTLRDRGLKKPVLLMGPFTTARSRHARRQGHHADGLHADRRGPRARGRHAVAAARHPRLRGHRHRPRRRPLRRGGAAHPRPRRPQERPHRRRDDDVHRGSGVRSGAAEALHGAHRRALRRRHRHRATARRLELHHLPARQRLARHGAHRHGALSASIRIRSSARARRSICARPWRCARAWPT